MAAIEVFADDGTGVVTSGGTTAPAQGTVETWTVSAAISFPVAVTGVSQFYVADMAAGSEPEKILVTSCPGSTGTQTWTVTRGADGTTPVTHRVNFNIAQVATAGSYRNMWAPSWLNARTAYGAQGNGVILTDAAMASGSTTLTSASSPFLSTDVGKLIYVYGAASGGGWLSTTISGYNSAGSVTLTSGNAFGAAISGCHCVYGSDDTTALQNWIAGAESLNTGFSTENFTATAYLPLGVYIVNSAFSLTGNAFSLRGDGFGSVIFNGSSNVFDFQNDYVRGSSFLDFSVMAAAGHIFTNINLHRCSFARLQAVQYSPSSSIMTLGASGSGLSATKFSEIMFTGYGIPATGVRSVPLWNFQVPGAKNMDVVTWERCSYFWDPPANVAAPDTTQRPWDIACTAGTAGGIVDRITFTDCDGGTCMGGLIRLLSVQGIVITRAGYGNIYNQDGVTVGNSMIYIGNYPGNPASASSQSPVITVPSRESSGTITWGTYSDLEIDSTVLNATIISPNKTDTGNGFKLNVNGASGTVIINPQSDIAIANQAADTVVIGNGTMTLGGVSYISNGPTPAANQFQSWNFDPAAMGSGGGQMVNGTIYSMLIEIKRSVTITNLGWWVTTAGTATAVTSENWIGIYSVNSAFTTATRVAQVGIDAKVTGASASLQSGTISSTTLTPGYYLVQIVMNTSGTPPSLGKTNATAAQFNMNTSAATLRCAVAGTTQTVLASSVTMSSLTSTNAFPFLVAAW